MAGLFVLRSYCKGLGQLTEPSFVPQPVFMDNDFPIFAKQGLKIMTTQNGTFVATGQSDGLAGKRHRFRITGFGVASLQPQTYLGGAWVNEGAAISADTTLELAWDIGRDVRLDCTAYTSGTIAYEHVAEG